jgi:hypothetical protein
MVSVPAQVQKFKYLKKKVQTVIRTGMNSRMMTWPEIGIVLYKAG